MQFPKLLLASTLNECFVRTSCCSMFFPLLFVYLGMLFHYLECVSHMICFDVFLCL